MNYFRLQQDSDFPNTPFLPTPVQGIDWRDVLKGRGDTIEEVTVFPLKTANLPDCIDLVDNQFFLVSELLKKVIEMYAPKLVFKIVALVNAEQKWQFVY
ncbi:MAG: hypothetical protein LBR56_05670, partial [Sporomusaceae bacterium]|nr:hypothetical protein [Sporomusaceae bacterium]